MTTAPARLDWLDANQAYLTAEFSRIEALVLRATDISCPEPTSVEQPVEAARAALTEGAALDTVSAAFDLTPFERDVLLLGAGVEMHRGIALACSRANGTHDRAFATFGLALMALPNAHWSALSPAAPLRRWHLIEPVEGLPITASSLRIDERICHALAGVNALDQRLEPIVRRHTAATLMAVTHDASADAIAAALADPREGPRVVQLYGNDPDGQADIAALAAARLGLTLFTVRADVVPTAPSERLAFATIWAREAVLLGAALLIEDGATSPLIDALVDQLPPPIFLTSREPLSISRPCLRVGVDRPDGLERTRLWRLALEGSTEVAEEPLEVVAGQFQLSARAITVVAAAARRAVEDGADPASAVAAICRIQSRAALDDLAQRIEPRSHWNELIVPGDVADVLQEVMAHVQHRGRVYDTWGFGEKGSRGLGITALFTGESGTGKSMAAEVLASELRLDLYRIDLSTVVSKYIGETEKNLRRAFDAADKSGAILLFDESDALFGKRSDVRDSHDRYANIEVSYLLQRMDAYAGLAILTTNMKTSLDRAFQRRLRFIVQFPFPDLTQRERIWRSVFPAATPTRGLDHARLARISVAGGGIRNIALNAAFLAARSGGPVTMTLIREAARNELRKLDRPINESELR